MPPISDYILSIHYLPAGSSALLSCLALTLGVPWKTSLMITCVGALMSCLAFYVQPLKCFTPLGGRFNVGVREVRGERGAMKPPVTVVYPTTSGTPRGGIEYLPFGERGYLVGLARYAKLPYVLVKDICLLRTKMRPNAEPAPLFQRNGAPRPMVVFSHGLGGFPHLYSTLLMDFAVRGAVVFAMTHMDGSAAYCRDAGGDIRIPLNTQVGWTTEDRAPQLEVRIRETFNTMKRICSGELLLALGYDQATVDKYVAMAPSIHLVGHSFGGATCLAAALGDTQDTSEAKRVSGIASVVVYDPWMVPLLKTMFYDKLTHKEHPRHFITPTLQIFSEEWMRNKEQYSFFAKVKAIVDAQERTAEEAALVAAADAKLNELKLSWYTIKDYCCTGHSTCTDVPLFSPVLYRSSYMTASPRGSIVGIAADTLQLIEKLSGPLPLDTKILNNPELAAVLRAQKQYATLSTRSP
ncbi:putative phospholipase A1 [Leishmania braziliensis MHOM/BR/75/M2904]|uniref:1-alkyl-2-acetylglycerophosphocholine esterase n=2 Tax=Leishmania braziliensis TaxID=5660 RepID=A4HMW9_LEIBR|nr:putative phospholipase A1 [Leishmania braziliensis MHOM/BR/75/M2904]CAJ2480443.1 unnamed protein product [Leishmania braziliensis]CAM43510.1 putative phospholipase A1 [Leishmania braziliensis MHOM/BR/75/M2904]SYZ69581.1 phospholipase_A1 [Leishmania braziliensis MHOM/BR/75/M2904]